LHSQFHLTDSNAVSVLTYGVTGIASNPIKEIRVVGHTHCGGIKACYDAARGNTGGLSQDSVLWTWLGPLRTLAELFVHQPVEALTDENVRVQMRNVRIILSRLGKTHVKVRGFVYELREGGGRLRELLDKSSIHDPEPSEVGV
jgi:carbonic anhydrase